MDEKISIETDQQLIVPSKSDNDLNVYLTETFYITSKKNTVFQVLLSDKGLTLRKQSNGTTKEQTILLKDIVGARCLRSKRKGNACTCTSMTPPQLKVVEDNSGEQDESDVSAYLYIYAYILKKGRKGGYRERRTITLRFRSFDRFEDNNSEAQKWRAAVKHLLIGEPNIRATYVPLDLRRILVILNPKSGSGKARELFQQRIVPVFQEAELSFDLHITKKSNWAREFVRNRDIYLWRAILCVGGDGIFFEVLNGLFEREDWQNAVEELPMGICACGSGNGLAHTISYMYDEPIETKPILASAFAVCKGKTTPMDIVRVETKTQIMFSFLAVGWGLIADIDIESERLRALGGQRFTLWSFHRLINLRTYRGKVSYIPALVTIDNSKSLKSHRESGTLKHSMSYNTTLNCQECRGESNNCESCDTNFSDVLSLETGGRDRLDSWFSATSRKSTYFSTADSVYESVTDRSSFSNGRMGPSTFQMYGPPSRLPALTTAINDSNWKTMEGDFVMVHAAFQAHIGADAFFAPLSKLNDGIIWMAIIKAGIPRSQLFTFLLGLSSGTHIPAQQSNYIQMIPVTAFRIEPQIGTTGVMTVDGESIEYGPIQGEIFPGLIAKVMIP